MNWVQWLGAGILVGVTTIVVVDAVAWLVLRIRQHPKSVELQDATISFCLHQETIDSTRAGAKQSAQSEALPPSGLERPEDVRHAAILSHSAAREPRARWLTFGVARPLQHVFRRSRTSIRCGDGDQR